MSQSPNPNLQGAWNCAQVGLLFFALLPTFGAIGLGLALLATWKQQFRKIIQRPLNWGLAILTIWLAIASCFAWKPNEAFLGLANLLPFFIFFAAFSTLIQTPGQLRQLAWILVIPSLPVVILGLGQLFLGWTGPALLRDVLGWVLEANGNPPGRIASVFMYANILAAYLQIVLILGLGLWIEAFQRLRRRWHKSQGWVLLVLSMTVIGDAIALILTSSRNAWGITFLACLAFALYLGWRWLIAGVAAIASVVLGAAFAPSPVRELLRAIVPAYFWARLTDQMYPDRPVALLRTTQWQFAWMMAQERPWMGWGLRNFTPLYQAKMQLWLGHPHNLLLMLTAEIGIPATLLFCGLVGWILARGVLLLRVWSDVEPSDAKFNWHQDRLIFFTFLVAFGACVLFNLLDVTLFDLRINTLGWLLLSAIGGVVSQYQRISQGHCCEKTANQD